MRFRKGLFYVLLAAATLGLSELLAAWRTWRGAPGMAHAAQVAVLACVLLGIGLWLGFLLYEVDRAAGRVRRTVGVYEWIIARRAAGLRPAPPQGAPDRPTAFRQGRG